MSNMFGWRTSLKELNLTNFNTNNVTNMNFMLDKCSSLETLNLTNQKINLTISNKKSFSKLKIIKFI